MDAELQRTPIDEFSGIPLPLHPRHLAERPSRFAPDPHHAWHNRLDPLLQDAGGLALRASRVQLANYDAHHLDYHNNFSGPKLPETDEERFRPIVLAAAEYIPGHAISFTQQGTPHVVRMSNDERTQLWRSRHLRVEKRESVKSFLRGYILGQDLSNVAERVVDEFVNTLDTERRYELGNQLLARAVRQAAEPVASIYSEAYRQQCIPADRARTASKFLIGSLSMRRRRGVLHRQLERQLVA